MKTSMETVTPDKAREYLESNTENRTIRQTWVATLAAMIQRGEWVTTHQGIGFDVDGRLVDGQHRLHAIVQAGKPVQILVSRGLARESYRHIDGGKPRTASDRLRIMNDEHDNAKCVSIVRGYIHYSQPGVGGSRITVDNIDDTFLSMAEAFQFVTKEWRTLVRGVTRSDVGAALACFHHKHPDAAREFVGPLLSGEGLRSGSPILQLREALLSGRVDHGREAYWKTITACRYFAERKTMHNLVTATEDFCGNRYTRLAYELKARVRTGVETKRRKRAISEAAVAVPGKR